MWWLWLTCMGWSAEVDLEIRAHDFALSAETERGARRAMNRMFQTYDRVLGLSFPNPTSVKVTLIEERAEYDRQARALGLTAPTLGFFSTARGEGVVWRHNSPALMRETLLHEASHFLMVKGGATRAPLWLHEGMATMFGQARLSGNAVYLDPVPGMAGWLARHGGALPTLSELVQAPHRFAALPMTPAGPAPYGVGWSICAFLMSTDRGKQVLSALLVARNASEARAALEGWPGGASAANQAWKRSWSRMQAIQLPIMSAPRDAGSAGWVRCSDGRLIREGAGLSCPK